MYYVGVDVGGTTVKLGIFTVNGDLIDKWEIPTRKENRGEFILGDIADTVLAKFEELRISKKEIEGIGIGVPGPVTEDGLVLKCANLGWGVFNVAEEVIRLTGINNVKVGNDANVAALGEMWKGGGEGFKSLVMITLGTGVGGGVILNGRILTGSMGAAGEIGHLVIRLDESDTCGCGKQGCLEQYASAKGIVKEAKRAFVRVTTPSPLRELEPLTAKDIFDYAKQGDQLAMELVEDLGRNLGLACSHIAQIMDPEAFVIGGGVSKAGTILLDVIKKNYNDKVMFALKDKHFCLATLGNDAGIYGSARMVME